MNNIPALIAFFLLALVACTPHPTPEPTYYLSGRILDQNLQPVKAVKIQTSSGKQTISDANGYWQIPEATGRETVTASKEKYDFEPSEYIVEGEELDLVFRATRLMSDNERVILNWFDQQQLHNGLLESTENGDIVSLYDNALATMVFLSYNDIPRAERVFDFFDDRIDSELLAGNGGFFQFRNANGVPRGRRWMGDNAWLLIALNNYEALTNSSKYQRLASEISNWLIRLQDVDGGLWGGFDENGNSIHKITEGNVDAFNAVKGYTDFHKKLLQFLENDRWDTSDKNLVAWVNNPQYYYAMDLHPWGFCTFEDFPTSVLTSADRYLTSQTATINNETVHGYCFDIDKDVVWLEGTGQMVVAFNTAGMSDKASEYLLEMEKMISSSALFPDAAAMPYATNMGTTYGNGMLWLGADTNPAISGGAWYLFGKNAFDPFAVQYHKGIPEEEKFWRD